MPLWKSPHPIAIDLRLGFGGAGSLYPANRTRSAAAVDNGSMASFGLLCYRCLPRSRGSLSQSTWVWIAGLALVVAGGVFAEWVFRRVATPETIRADLED